MIKFLQSNQRPSDLDPLQAIPFPLGLMYQKQHPDLHLTKHLLRLQKQSMKHHPYTNLWQSLCPKIMILSWKITCIFFSQVNDVGHQKTSVDDELQLQDINPENYLVQNQITSSFQHNSPSLVATREQDRQSCDGYNWRKYGQKQVKGSEYPRSYYKCTHPSCPMKKKVERSFDGNIAEIVYKGEHNHPKPQPAKRLAAVSEEQSFVNNNNNNIGNNLLGSSHDSFIGTTLSHYDGTPDLSGVCSGIENDNERHKSKKRKHKKRVNVEEAASQFVGDPEPLMQASTESTITGDGFRWRKYGQKIVKGNPYPRSYYRCSNLKCNVRKHIERVLDEPTSFIITYEGEHNHEMPDRTTNSAAQINILSAE
ncbi:probable WRKY transcription factor 4 isoform X3 [Asparagus officinalis]|uniref:probable WRKY transcription factor 4 isoform X3 n=1 Tax=Asparagus officinalis TaxID=4686 RepID=UPI00098E000D|nr:probable WRKY transcription factor 4 isoform X3 [Asparagus officinalis]